MIRISGVILPEDKKIAIGLTAICGLGRFRAVQVLNKAQVDREKRVKELTSEEIVRLQKIVDEIPVEGALKKIVSQDIQRLKNSGSYRGLRHNMNLPVRGQRTRSNARTRRGRRVTVGAMKKETMTRTEDAKKGKESLKA